MQYSFFNMNVVNVRKSVIIPASKHTGQGWAIASSGHSILLSNHFIDLHTKVVYFFNRECSLIPYWWRDGVMDFTERHIIFFNPSTLPYILSGIRTHLHETMNF